MTCLSFDFSYIKTLTILKREMDTNRYYLAAILEVFSDSADLARFLPLVRRQILTVNSIWFLSLICWHRMSTNSVKFLAAICRHCQILQILCEIYCLSEIYNRFCSKSVSSGLAIWVVTVSIFLSLIIFFVSYIRISHICKVQK